MNQRKKTLAMIDPNFPYNKHFFLTEFTVKGTVSLIPVRHYFYKNAKRYMKNLIDIRLFFYSATKYYA